MHIQLCKRMGVSYRELEATPALVVQDWLMDMAAEGSSRSVAAKWSNR